MRPRATQQQRKPVPCRGMFGPTVDDNMIDQPAFEAAAPRPDIDLDAILLNIGAGGQKETALRYRSDLRW